MTLAELPGDVVLGYPEPAPGRPGGPTPVQARAHRLAAHVDELLYGGASAGGKTDWLLAEVLRDLHRYPGANAGIFRRSYPELSQPGGIIPRLLARIPPKIGAYNGSDHRWNFANGSTLQLGFITSDRDVVRYLGAEYLIQAWDQLEAHTEFQYRTLRSRLRISGGLEALGARPRSIATANPGGRGHGWIKRRWVTPAPALVIWQPRATEEEPTPGVRCFVPALLDDNPHVDSGYARRLEALPPSKRRAWRWGDWDVMEGQRFSQWRRDVHLVDPSALSIPLAGVPKAVGVDYGGAAPFAALWGARFGLVTVVFRELYRAGLTPRQQAEMVLAAESPGERAPGRPLPVYLDPSTWTRSPEAPAVPTVGNVPPAGSIARSYYDAGLPVRKANNARLAGAAAVDEALTVREDGFPRLLVLSNCVNLVRTLPELLRDDKNPDDVDTDGEDHCLAGDTVVHTAAGPRPIADLVGTTGRAWTPGGWREYFDVRLMRRRADLVIVTTSAGAVTCTADHKLLTAGGRWVEAGSAPIGTTLCATLPRWTPSSSRPPSRSGAAGATTSAGGTSNGAEVLASTRRSGRLPTGPSPTAGTSTTATRTAPTTGSPTSSAFLRPTITPSMDATRRRRSGPPGRPTPGARREPATLASPPSSGPPHLGPAGLASSPSRSCVRSATGPSWLPSPPELVSAAALARPVLVVDVSPAGRGDVYDLAIADPAHAFAVNAGGLVVSNCYDALRYLLMGLGPGPAPAAAHRPEDLGQPGKTITGHLRDAAF